jgi:hypothetical protein
MGLLVILIWFPVNRKNEKVKVLGAEPNKTFIPLKNALRVQLQI